MLLIKQKNPQRSCFFYNAAPNNLSYLMALETGCYSTLNWQGDISTISMRWRSSRHSQCSISDCSSGTAIQDLSFTRILLKSDIFSLYLWSDLESLLHSDCTKPYNFTKSEISSSSWFNTRKIILVIWEPHSKKKIVLIESLIGNFSFPDKEKCSAWFITKIRIWTNL